MLLRRVDITLFAGYMSQVVALLARHILKTRDRPAHASGMFTQVKATMCVLPFIAKASQPPKQLFSAVLFLFAESDRA